MVSNKEIHRFAMKYLDKFRDNKTTATELAAVLFEELQIVGFEFSSISYLEEHSISLEVFLEVEVLDKVIDTITDIQLLGSIILHRQSSIYERNFSSIVLPYNRAWFIIAFSRLAILTSEKGISPFVFKGEPRKITLITNMITDVNLLNPEGEIEQRITITENGDIWFTSYVYGVSHYEKERQINYKVDKNRVGKLLNIVAAYFTDEFDTVFIEASGQWDLSITNKDGEIFVFKGSLSDQMIHLSNQLRSFIPIKELYLFDESIEPDRVNNITINYQRIQQSIENAIPDFDETLIIDRTTYSMKHMQYFGDFNKVTKEYELIDVIPNLLDEFNADTLFKYVEGNPENVVVYGNEALKYSICIEYEIRPNYEIEGSFDKKGLPEDWDIFILFVHQYMRNYDFGEIFDPAKFDKVRRLTSEFIYCSVKYQNGGRSYYYLTNDDSIEVGDHVYVLAGRDESLEVVEIVNIEYFLEEDVPFPLNKMRRIIRKLTNEDWEDYNNDMWNDDE